MARTSDMLAHPYPPDVPHIYTDHIITWEMLLAGRQCRDIYCVRSTWRNVIEDRANCWYVHDTSEEATREK
jgi:hypothetical protein